MLQHLAAGDDPERRRRYADVFDNGKLAQVHGATQPGVPSGHGGHTGQRALRMSVNRRQAPGSDGCSPTTARQGGGATRLAEQPTRLEAA